jgi:hypothetical protein
MRTADSREETGYEDCGRPVKQITHESDHTAASAVCAALGVPVEWVGRADVEQALTKPDPSLVALTVRCQQRHDHLLGRIITVADGLVWAGLYFRGRAGSPRDANWHVRMFNPDGPDHVVPTPDLTIRDFEWVRRCGEMPMLSVNCRCRCGGSGKTLYISELLAVCATRKKVIYL